MVNKIKEASLEEAREWGNATYLENGLVLTDRMAGTSVGNESMRLNYILMALCQKGNAHYCIDTRQQLVRPGDLLFVSEGHLFDRYAASPDFECQCIMLSTEFYHDFVLNVKNVSSLLLFSMDNPVVHLTPREQQVYSNYFQTIREKMADTSHHYRLNLVKALLLAMFYDMSNVIWRVEHSHSKTRTRSEAIFAQFIQLLRLHFRSERQVTWYARQLGITPKYLSDTVKHVSRRTPGDWIDSYVVLELRVLLRNTTKSIGEITDELHFPNQSYLGKYFKEHVGLTPTQFRKKLP
jgi:AraC-like DNA-binding protein